MATRTNAQNRRNEFRVGTITSVDMSTYQVNAKDQYGANISASLDANYPLVTVPNVGDKWIFSRMGVMWYLERIYDSQAETIPLTTLSPGDTRLPDGNVYLNGTLNIMDSSGNPLFKVDSDGTIHIKQGTSIVADL